MDKVKRPEKIDIETVIANGDAEIMLPLVLERNKAIDDMNAYIKQTVDECCYSNLSVGMNAKINNARLERSDEIYKSLLDKFGLGDA